MRWRCGRIQHLSRLLPPRGGQRSRAPESVDREVRDLVGKGAVEINLVAQDLTTYGWDLNEAAGQDKRKGPHSLARATEAVACSWLRRARRRRRARARE